MAKDIKKETPESVSKKNTSEEKKKTDSAEVLVETLTKMSENIDSLNTRQEELDKRLADAEKTRYPYGVPNGVPGIRKGEDPMSSRPYSMMRLAKALRMRASNYPGWNEQAKIELELDTRLRKSYYGSAGWLGNGICVPLASDLMPTEDREVVLDAEGTTDTQPGISVDLVKECRDIMKGHDGPADLDELRYILKQANVPISKDLSANTATSGGTLVGMAAQGELIEILRATEVMSRAGAQEIDLPPQGSIRFPRQTSSVTIAAVAEGATISESTPATSALLLNAKPYTGLTDIPDELMRFSTSVAVESWLRSEFAREISLQADRDMISGGGGTAINGIVNHSGISSVTASTTAANGDTLLPEDPMRLFADIADNDAPVDRGFFFALTNTLWVSLITTRANSGADEFVFQSQYQAVSANQVRMTLNGHQVITTTQVPTDRSKGSSSNLTLLLGGVGADYLIARAGVVEVVMTNSDASKFQSRLSTMRGTQYIDAGPRHEASFGMIDTVSNS